MNYPLISEYIEAIRAAEDNFATINDLRPVIGDDGNPVMTSGNFAVVFKMRDEKGGKYYAVKCFLKDQPNRAENYRMIAEELEFVSSSFLTKFQYLDNELFVDSANADGDEFPVLLMDWVDGMNLDQYIRQHIDDTYHLHLLAYQFSRLAMWLMPQPFAHGDLKPDNIMVREDGTLVLIDYDGMFVPAMKGQKAREMGSPDFRHPARTEDTLNEHIDDFSLASILLSLRIIAEEPSLLEKYGTADRLLFSENDYRDIHSCQLLRDIFPSECAEVNTLVGLFVIALTQSDLSAVSFRLMSLERPWEPEIEIINTEVTEEDKKDAWTDEYGVKYSRDGKKLIGHTISLENVDYKVKEGVVIVCDGSLQGCNFRSIFLPDSVKAIGAVAFANSLNLVQCNIPPHTIFIKDNNPWGGCFNLQKLDCDSPWFTIKDSLLYSSDFKTVYSIISWSNEVTISKKTSKVASNAFWSLRKSGIVITKINLSNIKHIGNKAFYGCSSLRSVIIPESVTFIGNEAFSDCKSLQYIIIPYSVTSIGKMAFSGCLSLQSVSISDSVVSIGSSAFWECTSLQSVIIPDSVTVIDFGAFFGCSSLQSVIIPDSVISIGDSAFSGCSLLKSVTIPDSVTRIGGSAFRGCSSLQFVTIPDSVTSIEDSAFLGCSSLQSVTIPVSVININGNPFAKCHAKIINHSKHFVFLENNLYTSDRRKLISYLSRENHFIIPDPVSSIGDSAFSGCSFLQSVTILGSVTSIGKMAFSGCSSLQSITIPNSVTSIGESAFSECSSLQSVTIPNSVTSIGESAFSGCSSLQFVTIPDSVTIIGFGAFNGCSFLHSINISDSVTSIGDWAFLGCSSLQFVTIPDSVTSIGDNAFSWCSSLQSVTIPDSVTSICKSAFSWCSSLESIFISRQAYDRLKDNLQDYSSIIKFTD